MYSLDNLAQGQIDRSPRNAGKGHINPPSEGPALRCKKKRVLCGTSMLGFNRLAKALPASRSMKSSQNYNSAILAVLYRIKHVPNTL